MAYAIHAQTSVAEIFPVCIYLVIRNHRMALRSFAETE